MQCRRRNFRGRKHESSQATGIESLYSRALAVAREQGALFTQRLAQRRDVHPQARFLDNRRWPYVGNQLIPADHLAGTFDERDQELQRPAAKPHRLVVFQQQLLTWDQPERAERQCLFRRHRPNATQSGSTANLPEPEPTSGRAAFVLQISRVVSSQRGDEARLADDIECHLCVNRRKDSLDGRHGPAVDDVFGAGDGTGAR